MINTLVSDSGGKNNKKLTGNTFLGVRPGTITKSSIKAKAKQDKKAAEGRKAGVTSTLQQRAKLARDRFMGMPSSYNTNIVRATRTIDMPYGNYGGSGLLAQQSAARLRPVSTDYSGLAEFAAKRDTATDRLSQAYYDKYALNQTEHDYFIHQGNKWMTDGDALTSWILGDIENETYITQEQYDAAVARQGQYEEYMRKYLRTVNTYYPDEHRYATETQFVKDAPLPPWIAPTDMNIRMWDYYTTYAHDVVQATADSFVEAREEQREFAKMPYKSAFSANHKADEIDSFFDLLIAPGDERSFIENTKNYFRDYYIKPIKAGKFFTVVGNSLWNLMDTSDFASRGVRGFVAGSEMLGGIGRTFEGQNEYWATVEGYSDEEVRTAQQLFMENGGMELLIQKHPELAPGIHRVKAGSKSEEEIMAELKRLFGDDRLLKEIYDDLDAHLSGRTVSDDVKQGWENVKKVYTDPSATFNADTGSLVSDILIESALDPGLVLGGLLKGGVKGTAKSAAHQALDNGFTAVLHNSDDAAALLKNKRVRRAFSQFVNFNEGKNFIFKDAQALERNVDTFIDMVRPHADVFMNESSRNTFKRTVMAHLLGKETYVNGKLIASTDFARNVLDSKLFKAAYYGDRAIDAVDSAIIKSSFAAPWMLVKGLKAGKNAVMNVDAVRRYSIAKALKRAEAAQAIVDETTGAVDVTRARNVILKMQSGEVDIRAGREALANISQNYDILARDINKWLPKFANGEISEDELLRLISTAVSDMTAGKYNRIVDLAAVVAEQDVRYSADLQEAFNGLMRQRELVLDTIERQSDTAVANFLDEVSSTHNIDELRRVFREHMDNSRIMDLRAEVLDRVGFVSEGDIDNIVNDLRNGLFSEETVTKDELRLGVKAAAGTAVDVSDRTIRVSDFHRFLETEFQDMARDILKPDLNSLHYPSAIRALFNSDESVVKMSLEYVRSQIDLSIRQIEGQIVRDPKYFTAATGELLSIDPRIAELKRLRDAVQCLDVVSLKDVEVITKLHTDRMAMFQAFANDKAITDLFDEGYDNIVAPALRELRVRHVSDVDIMSDSMFKDLFRLRELKYGFDRTNTLKAQLRSIRGISDNKLHTILNGLGNNFGIPYGSLNDIVRQPDVLRRNLEATVRTQFGQPKLGISSLTDMLKSVDTSAPSEYLKPYLDEFNDPVNGAELKRWFDDIVNGSTLDPASYTDKQMLSAVLMDPSIIEDYNRMALDGNAPLFFHISSSGLSSELNEITGVSFRRWVPIDVSDSEPLTLSKIKAAFETEGASGRIKRGLTDVEIDAISENNLRHMADWKGMDAFQIRNEYRKVFGVSADLPQMSEDELLEEVCRFLNEESIAVSDEVTTRIPHLVVHDMDGFNIPFFNRKVAEAVRYSDSTSNIYNYAERLSDRVQGASLNTYTRLASQIDDYTFSADEIKQVTDILTGYIEDINRYAGNNYDMLDFSEYYETFRRVISAANEYNPEDEFLDSNLLDDMRAYVSRDLHANHGEYIDMVADYGQALSNISDLTLYPKDFIFSTAEDADNAVYAALKATGRDTINVDTRIYVKDVLSYFDIGDADSGLDVSFEALQKMHNMSEYIIRNRDHTIVSTAEEFLEPYREQFNSFISAVTAEARLSNYMSTEFEYLGSLKIPDTAVESYLMAQKLYDDYAKYWLNVDQLSSFTRSADDLDTLKAQLKSANQNIDSVKAILRQPVMDETNPLTYVYRAKLRGWEDYQGELKTWIYEDACEHMNNNRNKILAQAMAGPDRELADPSATEDILRILEGSNRPDIFKAAARADYTKKVYSYRDGVLREGIEMASRVSEANSSIRSELRQLGSIDAFYRRAGVQNSSQHTLGMLYSKVNRLFDALDAGGFTQRESFQNFIKRVSEFNRQQLQQAAMGAIKTDGEFDRVKLLQELVYNGFNHTVYNSHVYSVEEIDGLKRFISDLQRNGDDYISLYEDRSTGNIFVYLNYKAEISTDGNFRYINRAESFEKPVRDALGFMAFDDIKEVLELDDIDDYREIYDQLVSCWDDTRLLSRGEINGTSGRVVTRRQAEEYLTTLPSGMEDMLSPRGLLLTEGCRPVIYDPGFVINEDMDILTDYLGTLKAQADTVKDDYILINEVFHNNDRLQLRDFTEHFTDEELIKYFGDDANADFVVVTMVPGKDTRTGLALKQIKLDNVTSFRTALTLPNTAILPYDMYFELANYMNTPQTDNIYKRILGKYLWVYKAFALGTKPGTWVRNYFDATTKAAVGEGEDFLTEATSLLAYHGKSVRDLHTYSKIMKADPALLTEANWNMIQKVFKTDMPYEDFEMLKGIVDADQIVSADKYFMNKTASRRAGLEVISGDNVGLRNLDEKDMSKAFDKYLSKEANLPLSKNDFLDIYFHRVDVSPETSELYESMFRKLSQNLRSADKTQIFDKVFSNMFKPFGGTEQITRYAQSLYLRDRGLSDNQILKRIHQTQFYNAPAWGTFGKLETIMPFITFKYNNVMFWIRMMEENPRYYRYFEDVYGTMARDTLDQYAEESKEMDYESDRGLQTGGIPVGKNGKYLNIGNSLLSAMNDFYGITSNLQQLNPLLRETFRLSAYAFGLNSNEFFSEIDLDLSDDSIEQNILNMVPGYSFGKQTYQFFRNIPNTCSVDGGPTMDTLFSTLSFLGVLGIRRDYSNAKLSDFASFQAELAAQGKWYDANYGKIVDISLKNDYGANDPNNDFEDVEAYMMLHFGKVWDANQHKFVLIEDYTEGGLNQDFDFDTDPEAWDKLQEYMLKYKGKVYDYNLKKFVLENELTPGGLNDPNITWEKKCSLMEEKFGLKWDSNQSSFVTPDRYIAGGLNDTKNFREVMALRYAMYGEVYNSAEHRFDKVTDSQIVMLGGVREHGEYDNYFSRLAIPRLDFTDKRLHLDSDGLLVTEDGKYVLTKNEQYNARVFAKFKNTYATQGRSYNSYKRYSYGKGYNRSKKPYKGRTLPSHYYTGFGWNDIEGYYRFQYNHNYQYHNPRVSTKLHRLLAPRITYPYGGGYNKYSFHSH